jgi:hypothetical protein
MKKLLRLLAVSAVLSISASFAQSPGALAQGQAAQGTSARGTSPNSGYSRFGGIPGNVLLAFAPR